MQVFGFGFLDAFDEEGLGRESLDIAVKVVGLWANVNRLGNHNIRHKHPAALLAGVYYTGNSGASLVFEDPRPQVNILDATHSW